MENDLDTKLYNEYLNGEKEAFELLYNKYKNITTVKVIIMIDKLSIFTPIIKI